jgi:hypothetical protein
MAEAKKTATKAVKKAPAKDTAKPAAKKAVAKKAPAKSTAKKSAPTHDQIAALAHRYWQERGHHHGSDAQDWLRAEKELRG